jgi:hypothetical protein
MVGLPCVHHKKNGHLPLIKRGNISVKGDPKEKTSQVTILLIKKEHYHFKQYNKLKTKIIGICMKDT